jgi:hypothetical protein
VDFGRSVGIQNPVIATNSSCSNSAHSCKSLMIGRGKEFLVASYNVCTLYQAGKLHQLSVGYNKFNIDFVAIQEHRYITIILSNIYGMINITINLYIPVQTKIATVELAY